MPVVEVEPRRLHIFHGRARLIAIAASAAVLVTLAATGTITIEQAAHLLSWVAGAF